MRSLIGKRPLVALVAVAMLAVACNDQDPTVASPVRRVAARAPSFDLSGTPTDWDFVALAGGEGPQGQTKTFTIAGAGSIAASAVGTVPAGTSAFPQVYSKGFALPPGDAERGLGLCVAIEQPGDCLAGSDDEIGDPWGGIRPALADYNPSVLLDFTGLAAGTTVQSVTLASLQLSEGWLVSASTDGSTYTPVSTGQSDGSSTYLPTFTIQVPGTTKFLMVSPGPGAAGNNYLLQSVTTVTQVCTDPAATNVGGALPCEFPPPCPGGSFTYSMNANGDLVIKYDQFPAPNDNSYGVNAVGWGTHGHKFSDLVGSDHAGFQLADAGDVVRLSFNVDYISADATAPSGYRSLGVLGGDGKMLIGTSTGITATTSLANNLNNINIPGLFNASHVQQFGSVNLLIDSPPTDAAHATYVISDPTLTGWDFHDTYYVTISAAKLASLGFDPLTWTVEPNVDQLHNSPAKACPTVGGGLSETKTEVKGKEVKITLLNAGTADAFLTDVQLNWPTSNGKLMQVKLGGSIVYDKPDIAGGTADLTTAQLVSDQNKRKIGHGQSMVLDFVFEKNVDPDLGDYASTVQFGSVSLVILPQ